MLESIQVGGERCLFACMGFDRLQGSDRDGSQLSSDFVEVPVGFSNNGEQAAAFHVSKVLGCLHLRFLENFLDLANAERSLQKKVYDAKPRMPSAIWLRHEFPVQRMRPRFLFMIGNFGS